MCSISLLLVAEALKAMAEETTSARYEGFTDKRFTLINLIKLVNVYEIKLAQE
ncbi:hypothetical protein GCM10017161_29160 [Thalassotalea marina]|uniref:Uncharacterized protein n=1 Tax=Thalassotalea marina TaxID=1673741 RepID=A0A919EML5_9GAMM|nr:hypothetical protein GCM10017161_29160 [Thalassotalea marina]